MQWPDAILLLSSVYSQTCIIMSMKVGHEGIKQAMLDFIECVHAHVCVCECTYVYICVHVYMCVWAVGCGIAHRLQQFV